MKHLIILSFFAFLTTLSAQAAERDLCICQTGAEPSNEIKFFKLGCKTWNMTQSCSEKITIGFNDSIEEVLANRPEVKSVKLGYVGHWGSSSQAVEFLEERVRPSIIKYGVYFDIHNSACLATENPYKIRDYLKKIGKDAELMHFYGNQAISTGGWDPLLPGKNNFWASVNGASLEVKFPNCKEYQFKECLGMFQKGETGICFDKKSNKYVTLECKENTRKVNRQAVNGRSGMTSVTQTRNEWVISPSELYYYDGSSDQRGTEFYKDLGLKGVMRKSEYMDFLIMPTKTEAEALEYMEKMQSDARFSLTQEL